MRYSDSMQPTSIIKLQKAAKTISEANYVTAFTGAGISAESGIPTFRGDNGIWRKYDPRVLEISFFQNNPAESWRAIRDIFYTTAGDVEPNAGHLVLAEWERRGLLKHIITQNIDDLHYRAGSRSVSEYHGNIRNLRCLKTGRIIPFSSELLATAQQVPMSPYGGILKPDFVFFGEAIPEQAAMQAQQAAVSCDVMLVIGSTGEVYPAAQLPHTASANGTFIIEINPAVSSFTNSITDLHLAMPAGEALPRLAELMTTDDSRILPS